MKKQVMLVIAMVFVAGIAMAQNNTSKNIVTSNFVVKKESKAAPVFQWENKTYDFKEIKKGNPTSVDFSFTNIGEEPLTISRVQTSCGCTVTDYSKEPIMPGENGFVKVTYNAANTGAFNKTVSITANTEPGTQILIIKGNVVE